MKQKVIVVILCIVVGALLSKLTMSEKSPSLRFSEDIDTCFVSTDHVDTLYIQFFTEHGQGYVMNYYDQNDNYGAASLKRDSIGWEFIRNEDKRTIRLQIKDEDIQGIH